MSFNVFKMQGYGDHKRDPLAMSLDNIQIEIMYQYIRK